MGLGLLPWIQIRRHELKQARRPFADSYLECANCKKANTLETRKSQNCGFLPPSERWGPGFPSQPGWPQQTDRSDYESDQDFWEAAKKEVCPGYLIQLPQVREAARALSWWKVGSLQLRYEDEPVTGLAMDSVDTIDAALQSAEAAALAKIREGGEG